MATENPNPNTPSNPSSVSSFTGDAWKRAKASTETPIPAWIFAGSLLLSFPKALKNKSFRPARGSILGFGFTQILGGYMVYDGDLVNGAGFSAVWSTLYLLVNGKAAIKSLRPLPAVLSGLAGFNAIYYGKRFFFPTSSPTNTA